MAHIETTQTRYNTVAQAIHWLIAILILSAIPLGWLAVGLPRTVKASLLVILIHKSIGVTVLALMILRLAWRLISPPPPLTGLSTGVETVAKLSHTLLYIVFFLMPISGFIQSSSGGHAVSLFGLFDLPQLPHNPGLAKTAQSVHLATQWAVYVLLIVHIGAAIWHAAIKRDGVLDRMLPAKA